jgi:hypothetical protein
MKKFVQIYIITVLIEVLEMHLELHGGGSKSRIFGKTHNGMQDRTQARACRN